jgi:hypothetical protein
MATAGAVAVTVAVGRLITSVKAVAAAPEF